MKRIKLSQGKYALVDEADYKWLNQWKWYMRGGGLPPYAWRWDENHKYVGMHRAILRAPNGIYVDHINNNGLDNQRRNLRLCTQNQNCQNRQKVAGTSKYKGVCKRKGRKTWISEIRVTRKLIYLGAFQHQEDAAKAYDIAALKYFGKFAYTNKQLGLL